MTKRKPDFRRLFSAMRFSSTLVLGTLSLLIIIAGAATAYWLPTPEPGRLPEVGSQVADSVRALLPKGGKILVVSDYCGTCRDRASGYVTHVAKEGQTLLVVEESPQQPLFGELVPAHLADTQVAFVSRGALPGLLGVRVVPAYLNIDSIGVITDVGLSRLGWAKRLTPSQWLRGWKRLFDTGLH